MKGLAWRLLRSGDWQCGKSCRSPVVPDLMSASDWWIRIGAALAAIGWQVLLLMALLNGARHGNLFYPNMSAHVAVPPAQSEKVMDVAIWQPSVTNSPRRESGNSIFHEIPKPKLGRVNLELPDPIIPTISNDSLKTDTEIVSGNVPVACEIHIHQRGDGLVQAIDFGVCTGSAIWQQQLLRNLQRAAELVTPHADSSIETVRTLTVDTNSVAPEVLAKQWSGSSTAPDAPP